MTRPSLTRLMWGYLQSQSRLMLELPARSASESSNNLMGKLLIAFLGGCGRSAVFEDRDDASAKASGGTRTLTRDASR